jgi:hypothetical protein
LGRGRGGLSLESKKVTRRNGLRVAEKRMLLGQIDYEFIQDGPNSPFWQAPLSKLSRIDEASNCFR